MRRIRHLPRVPSPRRLGRGRPRSLGWSTEWALWDPWLRRVPSARGSPECPDGERATPTVADGSPATAQLSSLPVDGIIPGVGAVVVFVPVITILMACISFLEDTGYMARAAFIMDRLMHLMGLHGRSFIPLIMGTGCNVPALQATRTIEARTDRFITILVTPLVSCSARLQVYILIAGTFFAPVRAALAIIAMHVLDFGSRHGGGQGVAADRLPRRLRPVRHGTAALPDACPLGDGCAHVGEGAMTWNRRLRRLAPTLRCRTTRIDEAHWVGRTWG